jgi:hypothetical protein
MVPGKAGHRNLGTLIGNGISGNDLTIASESKLDHGDVEFCGLSEAVINNHPVGMYLERVVTLLPLLPWVSLSVVLYVLG